MAEVLSEHQGSVPAVRAFQEAMNARAEPLFHPQLAEDGMFGPNTRYAYQALGWALGLSEADIACVEIPGTIQDLFADPRTRTGTQVQLAAQRGPTLHRQTIAMDRTPVFWGLAKPLVRARQNGWNGRLNAADRRNGVVEKFGKKSQKTLHDCFLARKKTGRCPPKCGGECRAANAPGRSSHELRSDGNAGYTTQVVGGKLKWWELGLDVAATTDLLTHLGALHYKAHLTYPHNTDEKQHVNFTANPGAVLPPMGPHA